MAGMSGSPVYVDGRIVGAVSYSLGAFSKEPIAGITPIDEMIEAAGKDRAAPAAAQAQLECRHPSVPCGSAAAKRSSATGRLPNLLPTCRSLVGCRTGRRARRTDAAAHLDAARARRLPRRGGRSAGRRVPRSWLHAHDRDGGHRRDPRSTRQLTPGDAVGVSLIDGDLSLGDAGTVTHIEDGRVCAFGHPFYNLGPTEFP